MKRMLKHLAYPRWRIARAFPGSALKEIEAAIAASESRHEGELRFAVEGGLDLPLLLRHVSPRQRAVQVFSQLRVWDTEHNSGVLIYVQLADRQVEILADRGINARVSQETWQRICADMQQAFGQGRFREGALAGIDAIGRILAQHFPARAANPDELPNAPDVL